MNTVINDAQRLLEARLDDLLRQADRGELVCGNFLTPAEASLLGQLMRTRRLQTRAFLFGGYTDAERKRLYILPSYLEGFEGEPAEIVGTYAGEAFSSSICALHICGSGYRALSHRDYLGSLLSLGIEREVLGDIVVLNDFEAILFCTDKMAGYLLDSIDRIASDKVQASLFDLPPGFTVKKKTAPIHDTIASKRFDCIIGALTSLSREKSQALIQSGLCEIDHLPEDRVDHQIDEGSVISVRGYGKYRIVSFDGETKKGRLRLSAEKYV